MWLMEELSLSYDIKTFKRKPNGVAPPELKKIHALGKSPILSIEAPGVPKPKILAESGVILEYLLSHFGKDSSLVPKQYPEGGEGQLAVETEAWMRYRYYMHYAEGSLMSPIQIHIIMNGWCPQFRSRVFRVNGLTGLNSPQDSPSAVLHQANRQHHHREGGL